MTSWESFFNMLFHFSILLWIAWHMREHYWSRKEQEIIKKHIMLRGMEKRKRDEKEKDEDIAHGKTQPTVN